MPLRCRFLALPLLLLAAGCALSTDVDAPDLTPEQRAKAEKIQIYDAGQTPSDLSYMQRSKTRYGMSCQTSFFGPVPAKDGALLALRWQAVQDKATAIVNVACERTSPLAAYPTSPYAARGCWPGYVCHGDPIQ